MQAEKEHTLYVDHEKLENLGDVLLKLAAHATLTSNKAGSGRQSHLSSNPRPRPDQSPTKTSGKDEDDQTFLNKSLKKSKKYIKRDLKLVP